MKILGRSSVLILIYFLAVMISNRESSAQRFFSYCFFTQHQCPNENVTFFLYTRKTQDNPTLLNMNKPATILKTKFIQDRPLVILIHGYTGHKDFAPNTQIRPAYFQKDEFNIISVDYKSLVPSPCYPIAVQNLPTVANCTAQLIDFLIDSDIFTLDQIHVIGFSLGAQTAGMIANYLKEGRKLKRITGLDPAKPLFIMAENDWRLDETDAEFVDVIHTDVLRRGVLVPSGHADFYANGGLNQPGCYEQTALSPGSCNHVRAPEYYAESIYSDEGFWGFRCAHWYLYALGFCKEEESDSVAEMGFSASSATRGLYFLTTNRNSPYARGKNFTTNTVFPEAEPIEAEAEVNEIGAQVDSTL